MSSKILTQPRKVDVLKEVLFGKAGLFYFPGV